MAKTSAVKRRSEKKRDFALRNARNYTKKAWSTALPRLGRLRGPGGYTEPLNDMACCASELYLCQELYVCVWIYKMYAYMRSVFCLFVPRAEGSRVCAFNVLCREQIYTATYKTSILLNERVTANM